MSFDNSIELLTGWFGRAFWLAFYLPALILVALSFYVVAPFWGINMPFVQLAGQNVEIARVVTVLLISLAVAVLLVGFNDELIRAYEGKPWWLKFFLLYPLYRLNIWRHAKLYGEITLLRAEYLHRAATLGQDEPQRRKTSDDNKALLDGLAIQMKEEQDRLETKIGNETLPRAAYRLCPTSFGNYYALIEEYAFERYGIDSVLFWPRMRECLTHSAPELVQRLIEQRRSLDLSLNLSFVMLLVTVEFVATLFVVPTPNRWVIAFACLTALILARIYYATSCRAVRLLGHLIAIAYDFHRHQILLAFGLSRPTSLPEEQQIWIRLAAFLRRGDSFYFPADKFRFPDPTKPV